MSEAKSKQLEFDFADHNHLRREAPDGAAEKNIHDLHNEDELRRILERGIPEELQRVQEVYGFTAEQVLMFSQFAKLRRETINAMKQSFAERTAQNAAPTADELNLGAYREQLEPQVREAVMVLRRKGYQTYESGFSGPVGDQRISLESDQLDNVHLPDDLIHNLKEQGITVSLAPNAIELRFDHYLDMKAIKESWDAIADTLPDLGRIAEPARLRSADVFRKKASLRAELEKS